MKEIPIYNTFRKIEAIHKGLAFIIRAAGNMTVFVP